MKPTVYVETSVISYVTSRPSRDLIIAANQAITREWWAWAPDRFEIVASQLVVAEAADRHFRAPPGIGWRSSSP